MVIAVCTESKRDAVRDCLSKHDLLFVNDAKRLSLVSCDAVIMDAVMRGTDALDVIDRIGGSKCVVILPGFLSFLSCLMISKGAKVVDPDLLRDQLVPALHDLSSFCDRQMENRIKQVFDEFGIKRSISGYSCLVNAVMIAAKDIHALDSIGANIYEPVAKKHFSTPVKVERVMRFAIESAMARGRVDVVTDMFGYSLREMTGKPTNSEFIARAAELARWSGNSA